MVEDSGLRYIYTTIYLQTIRDIEKQCIILFQEQGFINVCIEFILTQTAFVGVVLLFYKSWLDSFDRVEQIYFSRFIVSQLIHYIVSYFIA